MGISAVIITSNEERNIERCLRSLSGVVEEIIVVDTHSTDGTIEICRQYGVRLVTHEWMGFGPQKNLGIDAARHPYVLSMDADEALDEPLREAIIEHKKLGLSGIYSFSRLNYYYGKFLKHGLEFPDYKVRLFPRDQVRWNNDLVHEDLICPSALADTLLPGFLLHYTYYSIREQMQKANRYSSLGAELYFQKGKRASWFKILLNPPFTFLQAYILRRGFMDGAHGFVVAVFHSYSNFMKYTKLWELGQPGKDVLDR